jgi:hypothetical protein
MWASCINGLSPLPYDLRVEAPKFLKKVFHEAGTSNDNEIFVPVRLITLLGKCSTALYADCPNMPEHHIENAQWDEDPAYYLNEIGKYVWVDFDAIWPTEEPLQLRMVFNEGDGDCNDGLWGAVWERNTAELIANISSTGDCQATVEVLSEKLADKYETQDIWIPVTFDRHDGFDPLPCESVVHAKDLNLEKIVSLAIRMCSVYRGKWEYERQGYDL